MPSRTTRFPGDHRTRIVVAGTTDDDDCPLDCDYDFALARYYANGSLDASFGGDGKVSTVFSVARTLPPRSPSRPTGRIVAAGHTINTGDPDFALARYKSDGSLDGSFEGGTLVTEMGDWDEAEALAIQSRRQDRRGGLEHAGLLRPRRYNSDGSLNTSFSGDGRLRTPFGGAAWANDVAIQADGRIVAAGSAKSEDGDYDFAMARYHATTDNTPPNTTITGGPSGDINSTSATFAFVSSEFSSRFQCSFDGAPSLPAPRRRATQPSPTVATSSASGR